MTVTIERNEGLDTLIDDVRDGLTRSLKILREEAKKCVLLCANCHAMVESGVATLPLAVPSRGSSHG